MTLLTYQVFKTVAEQGSFRKAADIAHLPYAEAGMHKMLAGVQQKKYHMVGTAH